MTMTDLFNLPEPGDIPPLTMARIKHDKAVLAFEAASPDDRDEARVAMNAAAVALAKIERMEAERRGAR